jgi:hypothetical protein
MVALLSDGSSAFILTSNHFTKFNREIWENQETLPDRSELPKTSISLVAILPQNQYAARCLRGVIAL